MFMFMFTTGRAKQSDKQARNGMVCPAFLRDLSRDFFNFRSLVPWFLALTSHPWRYDVLAHSVAISTRLSNRQQPGHVMDDM
jgi:hypothetical protein